MHVWFFLLNFVGNYSPKETCLTLNMENQFNKNELHQDCPIRNILNRISDKWTLLVLYTLNGHEPMRFKDLTTELEDISERMLTLTLRTLQTDGFVERRVFAEVPPRVEYRLTARAHSLFPIINQLIQWAKDHMDEILFDRTMALNTERERRSSPKNTAVKKKEKRQV